MARDLWSGILSGPVDGPERVRAEYADVDAVVGLTVTHLSSRLRGRIARLERDGVVLRTPTGGERVFRLIPGAFAVDGRAVNLVRPRPAPTADRPVTTASGSIAGEATPARVAQASRIFVEGRHDAELLERVWGDDLRGEGIVVELLDGIDHLPDTIRAFQPGPGRRMGVLVDHLVEGSKEARLAGSVRHPQVLVTGTPFVDVWQAIRPHVVGLETWPVIPKGQPWKAGICGALGVADPAVLWRQLLSSVRTYADLEPALVGAVERLLDFLTDA
jgi:hypothetical protein